MAAAVSAPATGTETVTVASKLPYAYRLTVFRFEDWVEPTPDGGRTSKRAMPTRTHVINGTARPALGDPRVIGGYTLTHGVPADLWQAWLAQNAGSDLLRKGEEVIFATARHGDAEDRARDSGHVVTGLEPVNPAKMPAEFRKIEMATAPG